MEEYTDSEKRQLLNYAIENGRIDYDIILHEIQMEEREQYLKMHPFGIWKGRRFFHFSRGSIRQMKVCPID